MSDVQTVRERLLQHDRDAQYCFTCHEPIEKCSRTEELNALGRIVEALEHRCCGCPRKRAVL